MCRFNEAKQLAKQIEAKFQYKRCIGLTSMDLQRVRHKLKFQYKRCVGLTVCPGREHNKQQKFQYKRCVGLTYRRVGKAYNVYRISIQALCRFNFGAKGDGITDDTFQYKRCVGLTVHFPFFLSLKLQISIQALCRFNKTYLNFFYL